MESEKGYDFEKMSYEIIGAAIEVHKNMGPGFDERFYQRALAREFYMRKIEFGREQWIPIRYKNEKIGNKRVDFIFKEIILEVKAKSEFDPSDYMQTLSYLKASGYKTGLLINFGSKKVETRRLVN